MEPSSVSDPKAVAVDPRMIIHVGRPDSELPHKSFDSVEKFFAEHPNVYFTCVLWDEKDAEEVKKAIEGLKCPKGQVGWEVIYWKDDPTILNYICDNLPKYVGAVIVNPMWYCCTNKHISPRKKTEVVERCPECNEAVAAVQGEAERLQQFAQIFGRACALMNFDTRSGVALNKMVNPTSNTLINMKYALPVKEQRALALEDVWDSCKGKPGYLVSAGPSLEDAIPHLKRLQGTGPIICVGRSYKLLRQHGIHVDYTYSCEMFDWDAVIFDGVDDVGDTVLVYPAMCAPATVEAWPGRRLCAFDPNTAELVKAKYWIMGGNSVSHHMLNFAAQALGCEPLILIGSDLSYTKPRTHAEGTFHKFPFDAEDRTFQREDWDVCTGKGDTFDPEFHRKECHITGGFAPIGPILVRTSPSYKNFRDLFEILITKHKKQVYNACPNGLEIANAPYLDLATFNPEASSAPMPVPH